MKRILIFLYFAVLCLNLQAQLPEYFSKFASDTVFRNAAISICLRDGVSGEIIAGYNENMALGSASIMKLVTTSAALEMLGPDHRFSTHIGYAGDLNRNDSLLKGHLVIRGGGDPTLLSEYFPDHNPDLLNVWANALSGHGIRSVEGCIVADAKIFDYHPAASGWSWADIGNYYGAGPHGLSVSDNMYRIHFRTGHEGSRPELTFIDPEIPGLLIENLLTSYGTADNGYVYLEPYGDHAVIRGQIPVNREDFVLKASMPDPPLFLAESFSNFLIGNGFNVTGQSTTLRISPSIGKEYINAQKTICISTHSPPLAEIITITNRESVNLFAEHLLKYLGYVGTLSEGATRPAGIKVVESFISAKIPGHTGLYMTDGSGLSRSNALSSEFVTSLLHYMKTKSRYSEVFISSLPEAGEEGTLEYYFRDPVFRANLRAKSGTSTRIRNYAGYFSTLSGRPVIFAVFTNNFNCTSSEVTERVEVLLKKIIENY